jgi:hypothetical protein
MTSNRNRFIIFGGMLVFFVCSGVAAQGQTIDDIPPNLRNRAIIMDITARIVEQNQNVVWDTVDYKITIPGRPVELRLVGANIVISVQLTPYIRPRGNSFLLAQGQVWINIPGQGIRFHTCIETIPLEFEEQIFFFPLGNDASDDDAHIEIQVVLIPYNPDFIETRRSSRSNQ